MSGSENGGSNTAIVAILVILLMAGAWLFLWGPRAWSSTRTHTTEKETTIIKEGGDDDEGGIDLPDLDIDLGDESTDVT